MRQQPGSKCSFHENENFIRYLLSRRAASKILFRSAFFDNAKYLVKGDCRVTVARHKTTSAFGFNKERDTFVATLFVKGEKVWLENEQQQLDFHLIGRQNKRNASN